MTPSNRITLLLVDLDILTQAVGVLMLGYYLLRLRRTGALRNPLADLTYRGNVPTFGHVLGVFFVYVVGLYFLARSMGLTGDSTFTPGSREFHLFQSADMLAKFVLSVGVIVLLRIGGEKIVLLRRTPEVRGSGVTPPFETAHADGGDLARRESGGVAHAARGAGGLGRWLALCAGGVWTIMALSYVQLQAGKIVWRWMRPEVVQPTHAALEALAQSAWGVWGTAQIVLFAVVLAPLAEELFFRGLILQSIWRASDHAWLAIVLSGTAFGLIHHNQPQDVLPLVTMGILLGYLRVRYRSLTLCVVIHALFNSRTIVFALLTPELSTVDW